MTIDKKEKTKMANFNENVNRVIGYILNSQEFFIYRTGAKYRIMQGFAMFDQADDRATHRFDKMRVDRYRGQGV